ncbi:MAG: hypothetical protein U5J98_09730 [Halobacteriales archaeon]|nr:hypothetical protein [Halobacteriales archaeon]
MDDLAEKRVYDGRTGDRTLVVAAASGLVTVRVADGRVGEFGLARDCAPSDLERAIDPHDRLVVATDEDVLLADPADVERLEGIGFGPSTAVTFLDGEPLAAGPDGRLARYADASWDPIGELPAPATALDGALVGTAEGVLRLVDGALRPAGLAEVRDVGRAAGMPLVATADGLYELGNGWLDALDGAFDLVAGAPDGRAHAAGAGGCYARRDGGWERLELPVDDAVVAAAYGPRTYLLTAAGDLLVDGEAGWRRHPLGLSGVVAAAVC